MLVLPGIGRDDFAKMLDFVALKVQQATVRGYPLLRLSASIGGMPAAGRTVEDALKLADKLMYRAKQRKESVVTEADLSTLPDYRRLSSLLARQFYERVRERRMLVNTLAGAMGLRNGESGLHILHIRNFTEILVERLSQKSDEYSMSQAERQTIAMASALHDIGKMAIPDNILNKPGRLTDEEYALMKTHAAIGAEMLERLDQYRDDPLMKTAETICRATEMLPAVEEQYDKIAAALSE